MNTSAAVRADRHPLVEGEFTLTRGAFQSIVSALYEDAGIHIPETKATLVYSRLVRRLRALKLSSFQEYGELIADASGGERRMMLSALTTNVTHFFRESHHFEHFSRHVLEGLARDARAGRQVRIWSAGCSSGQEPYSIAMSVLESVGDAARLDFKILATDIDHEVLATGERGLYSDGALDGILPARRSRFFVRAESGNGWRVADDVRRLVAFRRLNLNADWPMRGMFQVVFCRNVVIYFDEATQQQIWSKFAAKILPGGTLYIGHSERLSGPAMRAFRSVGVTSYQRAGAGE